MQATLIGIAAASGALALVAAWGERRRIRRRDTHGIGWMPWPTLTVAATFAALVALGVAVKG